MLEMVVGFLFDMTFEYVLLIEKKKPSWQVGKINGVGGKIEKDETPLNAMKREFKEETGQTISNFKNYAIMNGSGWRVYFYYATTNSLIMLDNPTIEKQVIARVRDLPKNVIYNLNWLIPLALDTDLLRPSIIYDKSLYDGKEKFFLWED